MKILLINNKKIYQKWASKTYEYKMNSVDNDDRFLHISIDDLREKKYSIQTLLDYDVIIFGWNTIPISKYYTTKYNYYSKKYTNLETKEMITELVEPLYVHKRRYYIVQDLHEFDCLNGMTGLSQYLTEKEFSGIISPYKYASEIHKFKNMEVLHLPHHIDETKFKNFNLQKEYDIFIFGNTHKQFYPFRHRLSILLKEIAKKHNLNIVHWEEGIGKNYFKFNQKISNENLSKAINKSWLTLCTKSKYNFLLGKYFETSFSNSVIVGDMTQDGKEIWGNNFIELENTMSDIQIEEIVVESLKNKESLQMYSNECLKIMEKYYLSNYTNNLYNLLV